MKQGKLVSHTQHTEKAAVLVPFKKSQSAPLLFSPTHQVILFCEVPYVTARGRKKLTRNPVPFVQHNTEQTTEDFCFDLAFSFTHSFSNSPRREVKKNFRFITPGMK